MRLPPRLRRPFYVFCALSIIAGCVESTIPSAPAPIEDGGRPIVDEAGPEARDVRGDSPEIEVVLDAGVTDAKITDTGSDSGSLAKRVFVTSAMVSGDMGGGGGGLAAADTICTNAAKNADAGATSSFVAWLSVTGTNAVARLPDVGPWVLFDRSATVFASRAVIANGAAPLVPLKTETGGAPLVARTGTNNSGISTGSNCLGWTSKLPGDKGTVGTPNKPLTWSSDPVYLPQPCDNQTQLICFEK